MSANKKQILSNYVCMNPYRYMDIQTRNGWICCPSWSPTPFIDFQDGWPDSLPDKWKNGVINSIRTSVADGTYSHCDHVVCPHLNQLINNPDHAVSDVFITKAEFEETVLKGQDLQSFLLEYDEGPEEIVFGFDRACNLKCPSCRDDIIVNDREEQPMQQMRRKIIDIINKDFSSNAKKMLITGSGDPFYSRVFRDYLIDFDPSLYPNLEEIRIITNGNILNEKMWNSLGAKPFIKSLEISVDAGSKDTYENITRLNGDWDKLLNNVNFIATQPEIENFHFSMVVSQYNFREMFDFYQTFKNILDNAGFNKNFVFFYRRIVHWGTGKYSPTDIRNISVVDKEHPMHEEFINEVNRIKDLPYVNHNFHDLL